MSTTTLWWIFGLSVTVLLISLWGRAIVADREVVAEAAQELAPADLVTEQVVSWVVSGLELAPPQAQEAVAELAELPEVRHASSEIVQELVEAAYDPAVSSVDIGALLAPLSSRISSELAAYGIALEPAVIESALQSVPALTLQSEPRAPVLSERVGRPLTTATVVAVLLMATAGSLLLALSSDRRATLRALALRIMVAGLSFWVILQVAAWIADPGGGGSPLGRTVSVVLASRGEVPLLVAAVGVTLVAGIVLFARKRRAPASGPE
ncbi:MAG: hypothetical protein ACE5MI_07030 [Acidimicrobiia bacterium]